MRIRVLDVMKQLTMTKDNVRLTIDASVAFRVTNPVLSFYVIGTTYHNLRIQPQPCPPRINHSRHPINYRRIHSGQSAQCKDVNRSAQQVTRSQNSPLRHRGLKHFHLINCCPLGDGKGSYCGSQTKESQLSQHHQQSGGCGDCFAYEAERVIVGYENGHADKVLRNGGGVG